MWAYNKDSVVRDTVVFLCEVRPQGKESYIEARTQPYRTNQSREPRLSGWIGETDNVNRYARGVGIVTREAGEWGERVLVRMLRPAQAEKALRLSTRGEGCYTEVLRAKDLQG